MTGAPVAVVTDSACDLPDRAADGITIVPLTVAFGTDAELDREQLTPDRFWERAATARTPPTTASPPPAAFSDAYREAADRGASAVVSVHVSEQLSRTIASARAAAAEAPIPVEVIDTRSVSLGQGLVALAAQDAAGEGRDLPEVATAARAAVDRLEVAAFLETIEYLRRGGRVGRAKAALTEALRIRPVLGLDDGEPTLLARPRTRRRALEDLAARAAEPAERAGVFHGRAPEAAELARRIQAATGAQPILAVVGGATGAHLGPACLGFALLRPHRAPRGGGGR